jgi:hypothetical protein
LQPLRKKELQTPQAEMMLSRKDLLVYTERKWVFRFYRQACVAKYIVKAAAEASNICSIGNSICRG